MVLAKARTEGRRAPGVRLRAAIRSRIAAMTASMRVPPARPPADMSSIRTTRWPITVSRYCTALWLAIPRPAMDTRTQQSRGGESGEYVDKCLDQRVPGRPDLQWLLAGD